MCPNEFFWNDILWDSSQLAEEWTLFEVDIHAVAEACVVFADEHVLLDMEREELLSSACLPAGEGGVPDLLGELHRSVGILYFSPLSFLLLWGEFSSSCQSFVHFDNQLI